MFELTRYCEEFFNWGTAQTSINFGINKVTTQWKLTSFDAINYCVLINGSNFTKILFEPKSNLPTKRALCSDPFIYTHISSRLILIGLWFTFLTFFHITSFLERRKKSSSSKCYLINWCASLASTTNPKNKEQQIKKQWRLIYFCISYTTITIMQYAMAQTLTSSFEFKLPTARTLPIWNKFCIYSIIFFFGCLIIEYRFGSWFFL